MEHHYVSFGSSCPTSVATTAPQTPLEEFFEDNDEPQSFSIYERVKKIILGDDKKTEDAWAMFIEMVEIMHVKKRVVQVIVFIPTNSFENSSFRA